MLRSRWTIPAALSLAIGPGLVGPSRAQEDRRPAEAAAPEAPQTTRSPRGGALAKTARHQFEVFFYPTGLRVLPRDTRGAAVDVSKLTGTATFSVPGAPKPFIYPLRGDGTEPTSLILSVDLSRVPATGSTVAFRIDGLADPAEPGATFTVPFAPTGAATAPAATAAPAPRVVPMAIAIARSTAGDRAAIAAQRVCKVSGESLGSMGVPIKVTRGGRSVFLCCQACVRSVQADPDRYLGPAR
jgi:hypothetical protein